MRAMFQGSARGLTRISLDFGISAIVSIDAVVRLGLRGDDVLLYIKSSVYIRTFIKKFFQFFVI
jgi:hypothetical protein